MGLRSHHDLSPRVSFGTTHWEVGRTVADPNEVEQEIRDLFLALSS
jgi:hypothetical protein